MTVQNGWWFLRSPYCRVPWWIVALICKGWSIVLRQTVSKRSGKMSLLIPVQSPRWDMIHCRCQPSGQVSQPNRNFVTTKALPASGACWQTEISLRKSRYSIRKEWWAMSVESWLVGKVLKNKLFTLFTPTRRCKYILNKRIVKLTLVDVRSMCNLSLMLFLVKLWAFSFDLWGVLCLVFIRLWNLCFKLINMN